ncbi:MAG TPA: bifunctional hydroxymethylpyrimidine kinase/phosphomethylpyrimidine kinase [Armatimonadota bacterium]|jgi:hydroxymethylpyrimidine/phosphomethylpyrimidine kinase
MAEAADVRGTKAAASEALSIPAALAIAGLDSSAGAGLTMDVKVFQSLGVFAAAVATAVTAQDTSGVRRLHLVPPNLVAAQIDAAASDLRLSACKIGMLGRAHTLEVVEARLRRRSIPLVVFDPVLAAKDGTPLLQARALVTLRRRLLERCTVVTPNAPEAARILGIPVDTLEQARDAARRLVDLGAEYALVKGGHLAGDEDRVTDVLFGQGELLEFTGPRWEGPPVRGTGCMLSSALAAYLALGKGVPEAARLAHDFVARALKESVPIGKGSWVAARLQTAEDRGLGVG